MPKKALDQHVGEWRLLAEAVKRNLGDLEVKWSDNVDISTSLAAQLAFVMDLSRGRELEPSTF